MHDIYYCWLRKAEKVCGKLWKIHLPSTGLRCFLSFNVPKRQKVPASSHYFPLDDDFAGFAASS